VKRRKGGREAEKREDEEGELQAGNGGGRGVKSKSGCGGSEKGERKQMSGGRKEV